MTSDAFGPRAELYRDSATHGNPEVLERIVEMVAPRGDELLLDVGTGPGHTAVAFAPHVKMAVASDPSIPMLQQVPLVATSRGVDNVVSVAVDAHAIPFTDGVFDLVTCRVAAHHFRDTGLAVREMARVCKVGGRVFVVDVCGSEDPWAFQLVNTVERLRDPSHIFGQTPTRWQEMYRAAGLLLDHLTVTRRPFRITQDWLDRMDTSVENRREIERLLREATASGHPGLGVGQEEDGTWFMGNYHIQILGTKL